MISNYHVIKQTGLKSLNCLSLLCFCVLLPGLMTIAQVFVYEKGEGAKSVPPTLVLQSPKKHSINIVQFFGSQNGILRLKIRSSFGILYFSQ